VTDLVGLTAIWIGIYLLTGALVGPIVSRRLVSHADRTDRRWAHRIVGVLTTPALGTIVSVMMWPVVVTAYRLGFFLGAWDWKADRATPYEER
jgi:hypothetical protein